MLFVLRFDNKPDSGNLHKKLLPAHLEWLEKNSAAVLVAGSLRNEPSAAPVGGLWIVEAPSKADADALFRTDPFWIEGLRAGYELLHWSKAFERKVPV